MLETLDAAAVRRWCGAGLESLRAHQREIDDLNVYPVPDGDTGTNLVLTLTAAYEALGEETPDPERPVDRLMRRMARGALLGARGNSGVIVSQILRGMADTFAEAVAVRGRELARALRTATDAAYAAVARPVEGTVLSVVAAAAEGAGRIKSDSLVAVARAAARSAAEALARTPQQLPVLAQAGVVDAGGRGLVLLLDALVDAVAGESAGAAGRGGANAGAAGRGGESAGAAGRGGENAGGAGRGGANAGGAGRDGERASAADEKGEVRQVGNVPEVGTRRLGEDLRSIGEEPRPAGGGRPIGEELRPIGGGRPTAGGQATGGGRPTSGGWPTGGNHPARDGELPEGADDPAWGGERPVWDDELPQGADDPARGGEHPVADDGRSRHGESAAWGHGLPVGGDGRVRSDQRAGSGVGVGSAGVGSAGVGSAGVGSAGVSWGGEPVEGEKAAGCEGYGFEVQYLLDADPAAVDELRVTLDGLGESLVIVGTGDGTWNVHVHTTEVGPAIEAGIRAGRPYRIGVTQLEQRRPGRDLRAAVVVASGDGLTALFEAEGAIVVDRNPSTAELLAAIRATGAGSVVVLPNDANTHAVANSAAREAAAGATAGGTSGTKGGTAGGAAGGATGAAHGGTAGGIQVSVVPTRSPVQALAALAVRDDQRPFADDVIAMAEAAGACRSGEVCTAQRDALTVAGPCRAGDLLGLVDGEVHVIGDDVTEVSRKLLDRMLGGGGELVTCVLGADAPAGLEERLREHIHRNWPFIELQCYAGGQPRYHLLAGVE